MNSLFDYIDYREYIRDYITAKKAKNSHYSLRIISEQAGFKARDYILRVMNGSRNLSEKGIRMLSEAMHLSIKEAEYFQNLVLFNQTENVLTKESYFKKLQECRKQGKCRKLLDAQYSFLSNWYNVVVRSLLPLIEDTDNYRKIGRMLDPPLTESEIRKTIDLLISLDLIRKDTSGKYHLEDANLSVGNDVKSLALTNLHKMFIDLSLRSLDTHHSEDRDITGITMSISEDGYKKIKAELSEFRKKIMSIAASDSNEDRIYHLNLHLFPVTKLRIR